MANVQEIENEVSHLSADDLAKFRTWFEEFEAALWDRQFEEDALAGRLDSLAAEALSDFKKGSFKEL